MSSRRLLFRFLYRLGFTPWDGHALPSSLTRLVESGSLPATSALDVGCGTGDSAIYLSDHGWRVTGVDFVDTALKKARAKAGGRPITFVKADVTQLRSAGVSGPFDLVIDSGCLHGMDDRSRGAYAREITALTAPRGRLLIVAFVPGSSSGVPGITSDEVRRRFTNGWTLADSGDEPELDRSGKNAAHFSVFERQGHAQP